MSHGGEREGTGRKRGLRNRIIRELIERVEATGISPPDYILAVLRGETARQSGVTAAAPFVHPKLAAVKMSGDKDAPLFDLSALTDSELAFCGGPS
jgi:hypothetical protein